MGQLKRSWREQHTQLPKNQPEVFRLAEQCRCSFLFQVLGFSFLFDVTFPQVLKEKTSVKNKVSGVTSHTSGSAERSVCYLKGTYCSVNTDSQQGKVQRQRGKGSEGCRGFSLSVFLSFGLQKKNINTKSICYRLLNKDTFMLENSDEVDDDTCTRTLTAHLQCAMWINAQTCAAVYTLTAAAPREQCVLSMYIRYQILHYSACNWGIERAQQTLGKKKKKKRKSTSRTESRLCCGFPVCGPEAGNRSCIANMDPSVKLIAKCVFTLPQHRPLQCGYKTGGLYRACELHAYTKIKLSWFRWSARQSVMIWRPLLDEEDKSSLGDKWGVSSPFPNKWGVFPPQAWFFLVSANNLKD